MAPELLDDTKELTQQVDVYAFGVTMWEVFTEKTPYANIPQTEIFLKTENQERLEIPQNMPQNYQFLMTKCWKQEASERPKMDQVIKSLEELKF